MNGIIDLWPAFAATIVFSTVWTFYIEPRDSTGPK